VKFHTPNAKPKSEGGQSVSVWGQRQSKSLGDYDSTTYQFSSF